MVKGRQRKSDIKGSPLSDSGCGVLFIYLFFVSEVSVTSNLA